MLGYYYFTRICGVIAGYEPNHHACIAILLIEQKEILTVKKKPSKEPNVECLSANQNQKAQFQNF
jgi:hypothetical protein